MPVPLGWTPAAALAARSAEPWRGTAWRFHRRRYAATDATGSGLFSGRYHRGRDAFPERDTWAALYLALSPEICLGEILRHLTPERLPLLNEYRLTEVSVSRSAVLDCRDPTVLGLTTDDLHHDTNYSPTQELGAAAVARGVEGLVVSSATRLGDNLVVFPANLRSGSQIVATSSRDPRLYVPRT